MALRVQFLSKGVIFFSVFLLLGCSDVDQFDVLKMGQEGLKKEKGIYHFNGQVYNGAVYDLFDTGDTSEHIMLMNGVKNGVCRKWWKNGNLRFRANYKEGLYQGKVEEWYEDGTPFTAFNYEKGQECGLQQAWKPDGNIKANYEVVGDRKYGLTGVKNCNNNWNE